MREFVLTKIHKNKLNLIIFKYEVKATYGQERENMLYTEVIFFFALASDLET